MSEPEDLFSALTKHDPKDTLGDATAKAGCLAFMCLGAAAGIIVLGLGIPMGIVWLFKTYF